MSKYEKSKEAQQKALAVADNLQQFQMKILMAEAGLSKNLAYATVKILVESGKLYTNRRGNYSKTPFESSSNSRFACPHCSAAMLNTPKGLTCPRCKD